MLVYEALNKEVIESIPVNAARVLDIGCGDGSLGAYLKSRSDLEVFGITYSEEEGTIARTRIDKVVVEDLNVVNLTEYGKFDAIICSHVLEHIYQPELLLQKAKVQLRKEGWLIVALPNILHWKQRLKFMKGSFRYTEGGLMDKTHFRFYDFETAQELIKDGGFMIVEKHAYGAFPLPIIRAFLPKRISQLIDMVACRLFPGWFGFQFVFKCKPKY